MSMERSLKAWDHWRESATRLDYFILGISTALTAYQGQHLAPVSPGLNPGTIALGSLAALSLSVVAGIERLRAGVAFLAAQSISLEAHARAGQIKTLLKTGAGAEIIDSVSGDTFAVKDAAKEIAKSEGRMASAEKQVARWRRRAELAYNWRDGLLVGGVVLFVTSKLLSALITS